MKRLVLEDHNPLWTEQFRQLKSVYEIHLKELFLFIEHVGSTSIPGIKAKPVIDIDVVIERVDILSSIIPRLERLGYVYKGDLGIRGREAFWQPSCKVPIGDMDSLWPSHHLYVCQRGIESLQNHLLFRDYLRAHPEEAREYSVLKENLIGSVNDDIDLYVEGKSEFISNILRKCGFNIASLDDIRQQNNKK